MPFKMKRKFESVPKNKMHKDIKLGFNEDSLKILKDELASRYTYSYKWECSNGMVMDIKEMPIGHLRNVIKLLEDSLYEREIIEENNVYATDYYD